MQRCFTSEYQSASLKDVNEVMMNYYTIKDLESLSGIKAHTIRIWEKRYGLLKPQRTDTNIRHYTDEEMKYLLNVSLLVKHGLKISKVSMFPESKLHAEVLKLGENHSSSQIILDQLLVHVVNFDGPHFESIIDQQIDRIGFEDVVYNVVFPLFSRIGILWQTGSIFPAQEHFVSNLIRQRLIIYSAGLQNDKAEKSILFFLPENEMHEISLLFYNYLARKIGLKTIYLGQNVPNENLENLSNLNEIDFVFTAFINSTNKNSLENYLIELHRIFNGKRVFLTGAQLKYLHPSIPSNFHIIDSPQSFRKQF